MFCVQCGTINADGMSFCVKCGAKLSDTKAYPAPAADTSNQETVAFTPVQAAPEMQQPAAQAPIFRQSAQDAPVLQQPVQSQYQSVQNQYQQTYNESYSAGGSSGSSSGKGRTGIIVAIALVLTAVIGVGAVLLFSGKSDESSSDRRTSRREQSFIVDDTDPEEQEQQELTSSNIYYNEFIDADSYMLSATDSRYYSRAELSSLTRQQLYLAEREIYARHGCTFNDGDLDAFFGAKNWYTPTGPAGNFSDSQFSDIERVNLMILRAMIMERDGNSTSNEYIKLNNNPEGWILNFTDSTRITKQDVEKLSEKELKLAAQEIYARHGYIFEDDELQLYFSSKNWYTPESTAVTLGEIEEENFTCLEECAAKKAGVKFSGSNRYEPYYYPYQEYICPNSDTTAIDPYDLRYMCAEELVLARNEIYARYGYSFSNAGMREYFMQCSWYYPTVITTKLELIHLSKVELANVKMIQAFELNLKLREGEGKPNTKMSYYAKHDFLTMYLPEHWRDNCICIKPNGTAGDMYFYEKYNEEKGYGWLYTIKFIPVEQGLSGLGSGYELFGTVTKSDGTQYYVVKHTPTGYSGDTVFLEEVYALMESQIDTIWNSIEWKSGYTFTPA